jgi:hypothetical protein
MVRSVKVLTLVAALGATARVVAADALDADRVLSDARGKVVHLMVRGQKAPGEIFDPPIHGSGVVIRTSSADLSKRFRILTAGHVVKDDKSWARLGIRPDRDVFVTTEEGIGAVELRPITGVIVNGRMDIAQVVAGPLTRYSAELRPTSLIKGQQYVVVSWGLDARQRVAEQATAKLATIIGPDQTDPALVRLSANLVQTESGSPILDNDGAVVAIVVMREEVGSNSSSALALPVSQARDWIEGVKNDPVREPPPQQLEAMLRPAVPFNLSNASLCVFLGKSSALARADIRPPDAPFGRQLLQTILRNPNAALGRSLNITPEAGAINVRSRCPDVQEGKAYYGSVVSVLNPTATISLRQILPLRYLDDDFFWGIISEISLGR